jgi:hypothetical protein
MEKQKIEKMLKIKGVDESFLAVPKAAFLI